MAAKVQPRRQERVVASILCAFVSAVPHAGDAQDRYPVDWPAVATESMEYFSALLRTDTSNPPGNETEAARYLQRILQQEGIEAELFALDPTRANLVARLGGNGSKRPILVMAHTDVVGVQRENWSVDPFAAVVRDGYVYGRGSLDDKDNVAAALMLMLLLERADVELDRDVIFLAEAGEEGTTRFGVDYMVENHWDEIAAEYCLAEGGGAVARAGQVQRVAIATTEKFPMRVRLVAHGTAGHGSVPRLDNAVSALARAVGRLADWQSPMRLNETTRAYFDRLGDISPPEQAARYRGLTDPVQQPEIERYFAEYEPNHYSALRTSVVPTMMSAGFRRNVIPTEAEATIDIRGLPDEDPEEFYRALASVIDDPNVEIIPEGVYRPASPPSSLDNEMFQALEGVTQRLFPNAVTLPTMLNAATDMAQIRAQGTQCYGFGPVRTEDDVSGGGGAHGDDERILESSLLSLVQFLWYAVLEVAATEG
ncbi:MAG: peptidase M20 [Gemmatimonadetes bacterium]|nr:peptidase M20 [Gemmatimonadota bacterium]